MGGPGSPPGSARFWLWGALLGALFGAVGFLLGSFAGRSYAFGFRFDWYVQGGVRSVTPEDAGIVAALSAASVAFVAVTLAVSIACRLFDKHANGRFPAPAPEHRTRGAHSGLSAFLYGLLLPVLLGLLTLAVATLEGGSALSPGALAPLVGLAAGLGGFLAGLVPMVRTGAGLRAGAIVRNREDENIFAKIALGSARNAKTTLALLLVITLVAGYGATLITTNVDVADVMPRGDANTVAAKNLTEKFKSTFTQQVTFQLHTAPKELYEKDNRTLPYRQTKANHDNISDEVYVRAMDQLSDFLKNYPGSPFTGSVGNSDFYKLINWTAAGGNDATTNREGDRAFSLPSPHTRDGAARYAAVDRGVWTLVPGTSDAVISPTFRQTALLINVDPNTQLSSKEIGQWALTLRDEYAKWAKENDGKGAYQVFTGENAPKFSVDLPIANAHSSALAQKDFKTLVPIIAAFIVLCLFVAFRSWGAIAISFTALAVSLVWTFGAMGYMGIPLNTLNLTVIPLIMGVGIDYGIHMMNEYQHNKSRGRTDEEAFRLAGARGALALFVATLNTVCALLVMFVSPSLLIAQLGILSAIAIASSYVLAITLIPAGLVFLGKHARTREYRPSPLMGAIARGVSRNRLLVAGVVLLLLGGAYLQTPKLTTEAFGDPPRNWLPDDPLRMEHEKALAGFYDTDKDNVKANVFIFEGDITTPEAHRYMDAVEAALKKQPLVKSETLRSLPFLMRTYLTVKDGGPGAGGYTAIDRLYPVIGKELDNPRTTPYPTTQEEIEALMNEVPKTPLKAFANLFYDYPSNRMGIMTFSVEAATYEDAEKVWNQVHAALKEAEPLRPKDVQVAFFGNTAINYLFVAKELPWVGYMSIASNILVLALVYIPTRKWKPTLTVGLLNLVTSILWLGLLPSFGIGLAITLTLPLVFIYAIGSDYGLHLALAIEETKDPDETFRTTGKAILFSAITTLGAFLIFTQMNNVAVRRTMIGTALAICVIFVTTMLIVPMMYPVPKAKKAAAGEGGASTSVEPGMTRVRITFAEEKAPAPTQKGR